MLSWRCPAGRPTKLGCCQWPSILHSRHSRHSRSRQNSPCAFPAGDSRPFGGSPGLQTLCPSAGAALQARRLAYRHGRGGSRGFTGPRRRHHRAGQLSPNMDAASARCVAAVSAALRQMTHCFCRGSDIKSSATMVDHCRVGRVFHWWAWIMLLTSGLAPSSRGCVSAPQCCILVALAERSRALARVSSSEARRRDLCYAEQERLPRPDSEPRQQSLPAGGLDDVSAQVAGLRMSHHAPDPFAGACPARQCMKLYCVTLAAGYSMVLMADMPHTCVCMLPLRPLSRQQLARTERGSPLAC